jgi:hypothetical protein
VRITPDDPSDDQNKDSINEGKDDQNKDSINEGKDDQNTDGINEDCSKKRSADSLTSYITSPVMLEGPRYREISYAEYLEATNQESEYEKFLQACDLLPTDPPELDDLLEEHPWTISDGLSSWAYQIQQDIFLHVENRSPISTLADYDRFQEFVAICRESLPENHRDMDDNQFVDSTSLHQVEFLCKVENFIRLSRGNDLA